MKKHIKLLSLFVSIVMTLLMLYIPVSAEQMYLNDLADKQIQSKTNFASTMDKKYADLLTKGIAVEFDENKVESLKQEYTFASNKQKKEDIALELESFGVYVYHDDTVQNISNRSSDSSDVTLSTPNLFYESIDKSWTLTFGGQWKNSNWLDTSLFTSNIGDEDAFGIGFTSIKNSYNSVVKSCYGYITDSNGNNRVITYNRSDGNGAKGFGFRLQDKYIEAGSQPNYIGYKWYGSCTYDYNFSSYACIATAYYIHTYKSAEITSIRFGIDGETAGIDIEMNNSNKSFTAFSNDLKLGI